MVMVMLTVFYHDPSLIQIMIANFEKIKIHQVLYSGFLLGIFFRGAKSIVMQISIVILLFSDQILGRGKSFQGGKLPQGGTPLRPPCGRKPVLNFRKVTKFQRGNSKAPRDMDKNLTGVLKPPWSE